jgi:ubiquitin-conjugating enzyme E2 G1
MSNSKAIKRLQNEIKDIKKQDYREFSINYNEDNILEWEVLIYGPEETDFEGGVFKAKMSFPNDYPFNPPSVKLISDIWHPNIYNSGERKGEVCISILHVGKDEYNYEREEERWKPAQSATSILLSIISMIADPNSESPANVDAAVQFRDDREGFKKRVIQCVIKSQNEI